MSIPTQLSKTVKLANGTEIPAVGFGCAFGNWADESQWMGFTPEEAWSAFAIALRAGYRHFDAAYFYGTHKILGFSLGQMFVSGQLKRKDVFITSKVFHPPAGLGLNEIGKSIDLADPNVDVKKRVREQIEHTLDELMLGYVDLMLMHWPGDFGSTDAARNRQQRKECWEVFEEYYKAGKLKAIGVSNFTVRHLESLLEDATVKPMVNQIEISPYMCQEDLVAFCQAKGVVLEAWAPFGSGATGVVADPTVKEIAARHQKNAGQVVLRWLVQRGIVALPKSSSEARMKGNLDIFDFELSAEDLAAISALNQNRSSVTGHAGDGVPWENIA